MTYQIPEDTLPGARPGWIAPYLTILITGLLAGPFFGFGWAIFNGYALGCRDMARQWLVLSLSAVAVTATAIAGRWIRMTHAPAQAEFLAGQIIDSVSILILIVAFTFVGMRQTVLYKLHMRGRRSLWGIPTALGLIAVSLVLQAWAEDPLLREAIGGIFRGGP